jgi:OmpR-family two-component system manganese-sensing response regulator
MYSILLVEDDPSVKFAYRKILTKKGYTVSYASNGAEGLELAKNNDYDIIISDWLMPVMDGIELISKVRSEIKNQPIIFLLTAVNSSDARSKALFAGADEY